MDAIKQSLAFDPRVFLLQIVVFTGLLIVMNAIFWKPLLAHLNARTHRIADAYRTRDGLQLEMESLRADYITRITEIEAEARRQIQTAVKEAQDERERLIAEARDKAAADVAERSSALEREKAETLVSLRSRMAAMASTAVGKTLGSGADSHGIQASLRGASGLGAGSPGV